MDIDKLYILGYSINDNGNFQTVSALGQKYDVNQVMKLPIPNGVRYTIGENGYNVTAEDALYFDRGDLTIFADILNSGLDTVTFDPSIDQDTVFVFMKDLNAHTLTKMSDEMVEEGLKNNIVNGIFDVVMNPRNQINLHVPINMNDQQAAATLSALGQEEQTRSADNPGSKFVMQIQNMVGKEVIGITAVSIKGFFLLSNYYNTEFGKLIPLLENGSYTDAANLIHSLVFRNPLSGRAGVLANINFEVILDFIKQNDIEGIIVDLNQLDPSFSEVWANYLNGNLFNIKDVVEMLQDNSNVPDASLVLSGLLSAATDNAKELILSKINATSNYVDIYNYLISIGVPFNDIAQIMTSDIFNYIVKITDSNIFDPNTYNFSLNNAIAFYLNEKLLPVIDSITFNKIFNNFIDQTGFVNVINFTTDSEMMNKFREHLEKLAKKKVRQASAEDMQYQEEMMMSNDESEQSMEFEEGDYSDMFSYDNEYMNNSQSNPTKRDFAKNKLNQNDYKKALTLVQYILRRNNTISQIQNAQEQLDNLASIYHRVLPAIKEMQNLGRMAGINQGIRTNTYDKYSYIKGIETYINGKVKEFNKNNSMQLDKFNLFSFLSDETAKENYIRQYEYIKDSHNILRAISTVPHFNEMFKILYYDDQIINQLSIKNRVESTLADIVVKDVGLKLNDLEYKELQRYANDVLIFNWISRLDRNIVVPVGQQYFTDKLGNVSTNSSEDFRLQLNTVEGIASFKMLMDEYIIPTLKNDNDFKDNQFIKSLTIGANSYNDQINTYWKLPINMSQISNSIKNETAYENILVGFNDLNGKTFNDWNIVDLFYLYNLIVNKDGFGQKSMTRLFEDIVKLNKSDLLVTQYYDYLSKIDYNQDEANLEYNINDLIYRLSQVSTNPYSKFEAYLTDFDNIVNIQTTENGYDQILQQDVRNIKTSYFTLNMPFLNAVNSRSVLQLKEVKPKDNRYFKTNLDSREIIFTLTDLITNKYNGAISIVTNEDLVNSDSSEKNAKAFINNGEVIINIDKADISSPIHEFTHVILAGMKQMYPQVYYNLLSTMSTHPLYEDISNNPLYANKFGSDLDEEVFATIMGEYFKNKVYDWSENNQLTDSDQFTKNVIQEIFQIDSEGLDIQSLMNVPLETALYNFGSLLVNWELDGLVDVEHVKLNQRLATLKNNLISEEVIKQECYEG